MKKILLSLVAIFAMASFTFAQGKADFNTLTANASYTSRTTTAGWKGTNCAVFQYGTGNSGTNFDFITSGEKALCMNGKTSAVGSITSPTLEGGIGTLTFKFGHAFSESKGVDVTISVKQSGTVVATTDLVETSVIQLTAYDFEYEFNISGDFVIEIKNNSPSNNSSKNKDRVAIWNLEWTGYVGGGDEVQKPFSPAFSLGEGTYYEAQSVELSCATEDATIYYTIDGNEPDANSTVYSEAIQVAETTTIKAVAIKDEVSSNVATATFTIVEPEVLENIAAFYEIVSSKGKAVKFANPLTVIYQNYNNLLVKDETGTMLIYGSTSQEYSNGDIMEAGTIGTIGAYGGNPQLAPVSTKELPNATAGTPVEPKEVTIAELSECSFLDYVKVEDVTFTLDSGKQKNYTISKDSESFAVYNQFNLTISNLGAGKLFDVTGFMSSYNGTVQLQPTSVEYDDLATGIEEIVTENAPVEYYNLQGVKVANPAGGIFIKKQGGKATKVIIM